MNLPIRNRQRRRPQSGFSLILMAALLIVFVGVLGLTADLGRLYVARTELQSFADAAALSAALELDGTPDGIARAREAASHGPSGATASNRWNFATETVGDVRTEFAKAPSGPFASDPDSPRGCRFVRVSLNEKLPFYFLPAIDGLPSAGGLAVTAVGGQAELSALSDGVDPFSPAAVDPQSADFGFQKDSDLLYALSRGSPGAACSGDARGSGGESNSRGYLDVGQGEGPQALRNAVLSRDFFLPAPLRAGETLRFFDKEPDVGPMLEARFSQDLDTESATYSVYRRSRHNGRRILTVPVNHQGRVIGFAAFFLRRDTNCFHSATAPCCAEYIGPAVLNGRYGGASDRAGLYAVRLFQ